MNCKVGIALSKDRTLPFALLEHTFPGAYGLMYHNNLGVKEVDQLIVSYVKEN